MYRRGKKLSKPKTEKQSEEKNIYIYIYIYRIIKDRIIRDIWTLYET